MTGEPFASPPVDEHVIRFGEDGNAVEELHLIVAGVRRGVLSTRLNVAMRSPSPRSRMSSHPDTRFLPTRANLGRSGRDSSDSAMTPALRAKTGLDALPGQNRLLALPLKESAYDTTQCQGVAPSGETVNCLHSSGPECPARIRKDPQAVR